MVSRTSEPDATFEHAFGIVRKGADDWFDPKLHTDTDLFVDPFLMFDETAKPWSEVHDRLIDLFNTAMEHVAAAKGDRASVEWQRAGAMLSFPEPAEFCLGYGVRTIFGSGSGKGLGQAMLKAAHDAIQAGLNNIDEFGELMLFGEGFGADRISDMVCNVVKDDLVRYTQRVAKRHGLPLTKVRLNHVGYDFEHDRWHRRQVELPANPCWDRPVPVLLVPERFLDELPKMDDGAFWDWVYTNQNEQLRKDLGYDLTSNLNRKQILDLAKNRPTLRWKYGKRYAAAAKADPPKPYDLDADPSFKVTSQKTSQTVSAEANITPPANEEQFCTFVGSLATEFKKLVEDRGIWRSFWSKDVPHRESNAQDMFHASVLRACKDRDIDVSPEANAGQGPVDFKFSAGWTRRAVVELKFAKSSSFWDNLEKQVKAYQTAEGVSCGYIVIVQHADEHCEPDFVQRAKEVVTKVAAKAGWTYEAVFVDVRPRPSASKLKRDQ